MVVTVRFADVLDVVVWLDGVEDGVTAVVAAHTNN
jgi:hypothetical protein